MHPFIRSVTHVALFASGMFGAAAGLRSLESMPFWSWTKNKLGAAVHQLDGCDTVFVGSSRVQYGARPEIFDERMGELGAPSKSLNLGLSGLRQYDTDQVVDWVLAHRSPSLRSLVIELHTWRQVGSAGQWFTDQEVESHTTRTAVSRLLTVLTDSQDLPRKASELTYSLLHSLGHVFRVGQGSRIVAEWMEGPDVELPPKLLADGGWRDVSRASTARMRDVHAAFLADPSAYLAQVEVKKDDLAPAWLTGTFDSDFLLEQARRIRAHGVEPIYVVFPTLVQDFWGRGGVADVRDQLRILELDDPNELVDLFQASNFYDQSHLTAEGAARFSRALADKIAPPKLTTAIR